ncbi:MULTISPECIES: hypothetical protein [Xanthobacteraceae]|uniref:hypothetical protein n=1 Tax=Xanthobacteraceae TaxID=335928 RepID=UPI002ACA0B92|nr:hypothetical protein [Labrys sp. ZIDIC5]MDZ5451463.1 hypothetical protein [Labrys sp. ZIDIC5]HML29723.1 hypothetical protein [Hyphomicrobium sp.]
MSFETAGENILVFLPNPAAQSIVTRLAQHGYKAAAMSTVPELFDALRSNEFAFAITTRPDITLLRSIRTIPVINIEIFFHADPNGDGGASKRFDGKAFMDRVEFLSRPTVLRQNEDAPRHRESGQQKAVAPRWWSKIKGVWQRANNRCVPDVRA